MFLMFTWGGGRWGGSIFLGKIQWSDVCCCGQSPLCHDVSSTLLSTTDHSVCDGTDTALGGDVTVATLHLHEGRSS